MIRVFTPIWVIVYLALTPLIAFKYSADVVLAFLSDYVFCHLTKGPVEEDKPTDFSDFQSLFAKAGFWLWGSLLFIPLYLIFTVSGVLYRTWMLLYGTVQLCKFRAKFEGEI